MVEKQEIVAMIREGAESVFSTMLTLPIHQQPPRQEAGDPKAMDGVIALVGIAGKWTGTGRIHCSAEFECKIAGALVMSEYTSVDEEVLDGVAEVANMIIGHLKTSLEGKLGPLGMSVPTVIFGRNYQARTAAVTDWTVVPFESDGQTMEVRFCLAETAPVKWSHATRTEPAIA